jgi:hypothetical protein
MPQRKSKVGLPLMPSTRSRALIAIAFAGGFLNTHLPTHAYGSSESSNSTISEISNSTNITPEWKAQWLLRLASEYLISQDAFAVEAKYIHMGSAPTPSLFSKKSRREDMLVHWANQVSLEENRRIRGSYIDNGITTDSRPLVKENLSLSHNAIQKALMQLEQDNDQFSKLNLYFVASTLCEKAGDLKGRRKCIAVLSQAFQACELHSQIDESLIKASSSVLNSMAYGLIPIEVPDGSPPLQTEFFTEQNFRECEKLKLRALAMTDRLDAKNHLRRRAHRDMAIWYQTVGKQDLAEAEKQKLFELVGFKDDNILYPQPGACGSYVWWQKTVISSLGDQCGMG